MQFGGPTFVLMIVMISCGAWLANNWIRARHGYSVSDDWGRNIEREDTPAKRALALLADDNAALSAKIVRLEERLAVLERIATDPAERTAREIERLR